MSNHCLKFPSELEAIGAMPQFYGEDDWIKASHTHALDPIGTLYRETGALTAEGDSITEAIDGWHANLDIAELPDALAPYVVEPVHPKRVWA